jgi:glycosyltransferase involved in cell wall biosynthesis
MDLSVIIPAFNEEALIGQTIDRIKLAISKVQGTGFSWEIIVCDNNSTDQTADVALQRGARLTFEPINQISKARNTGAEIARGKWLLFVDADTYPGKELMQDVVKIIAGGRHIGCGATVEVVEGTLLNKLRMERLNPLFRLFNWCGGAFILCQREAFQSISGFSTALYAYEEIDFIIRLKRFGRKRGLKFIVLHRHPVITSGRKGDYGFLSLGVLFISNVAAVFLFALHYILPRSIISKLGSSLLGYWYAGRR